jgi:hypothetical protein
MRSFLQFVGCGSTMLCATLVAASLLSTFARGEAGTPSTNPSTCDKCCGCPNGGDCKYTGTGRGCVPGFNCNCNCAGQSGSCTN